MASLRRSVLPGVKSNFYTPEEELAAADSAAQRQLGELSEFDKGFRRGLLRPGASAADAVGQLLEPVAPALSDTFFRAGALGHKDIQTVPAAIQDVEDISTLGEGLKFISGSSAEMVPQLAETIATLPLGAGMAGHAVRFGLNALQQTGEQARRYREDPGALANSSPGERVLSSLTRGVFGGALDTVADQLLVGRLLKPAAKAATKVKPGLGAGVKRIAGAVPEAAVSEGLPEMGQEFLGQQLHAQLNDKRDTTHDRSDLVNSFFGGWAGGLGMSAAGRTAEVAKVNASAVSNAIRDRLSKLLEPAAPSMDLATASDEDVLQWELLDAEQRQTEAESLALELINDESADPSLRERAKQFYEEAKAGVKDAWQKFAEDVDVDTKLKDAKDSADRFIQRINKRFGKGGKLNSEFDEDDAQIFLALQKAYPRMFDDMRGNSAQLYSALKSALVNEDETTDWTLLAPVLGSADRVAPALSDMRKWLSRSGVLEHDPAFETRLRIALAETGDAKINRAKTVQQNLRPRFGSISEREANRAAEAISDGLAQYPKMSKAQQKRFDELMAERFGDRAELVSEALYDAQQEDILAANDYVDPDTGETEQNPAFNSIFDVDGEETSFIGSSQKRVDGEATGSAQHGGFFRLDYTKPELREKYKTMLSTARKEAEGRGSVVRELNPAQYAETAGIDKQVIADELGTTVAELDSHPARILQETAGTFDRDNIDFDTKTIGALSKKNVGQLRRKTSREEAQAVRELLGYPRERTGEARKKLREMGYENALQARDLPDGTAEIIENLNHGSEGRLTVLMNDGTEQVINASDLIAEVRKRENIDPKAKRPEGDAAMLRAFATGISSILNNADVKDVVVNDLFGKRHTPDKVAKGLEGPQRKATLREFGRFGKFFKLMHSGGRKITLRDAMRAQVRGGEGIDFEAVKSLLAEMPLWRLRSFAASMRKAHQRRLKHRQQGGKGKKSAGFGRYGTLAELAEDELSARVDAGHVVVNEDGSYSEAEESEVVATDREGNDRAVTTAEIAEQQEEREKEKPRSGFDEQGLHLSSPVKSTTKPAEGPVSNFTLRVGKGVKAIHFTQAMRATLKLLDAMKARTPVGFHESLARTAQRVALAAEEQKKGNIKLAKYNQLRALHNAHRMLRRMMVSPNTKPENKAWAQRALAKTSPTLLEDMAKLGKGLAEDSPYRQQLRTMYGDVTRNATGPELAAHAGVAAGPFKQAYERAEKLINDAAASNKHIAKALELLRKAVAELVRLGKKSWAFATELAAALNKTVADLTAKRAARKAAFASRKAANAKLLYQARKSAVRRSATREKFDGPQDPDMESDMIAGGVAVTRPTQDQIIAMDELVKLAGELGLPFDPGSFFLMPQDLKLKAAVAFGKGKPALLIAPDVLDRFYDGTDDDFVLWVVLHEAAHTYDHTGKGEPVPDAKSLKHPDFISMNSESLAVKAHVAWGHEGVGVLAKEARRVAMQSGTTMFHYPMLLKTDPNLRAPAEILAQAVSYYLMQPEQLLDASPLLHDFAKEVVDAIKSGDKGAVRESILRVREPVPTGPSGNTRGAAKGNAGTDSQGKEGTGKRGTAERATTKNAPRSGGVKRNAEAQALHEELGKPGFGATHDSPIIHDGKFNWRAFLGKGEGNAAFGVGLYLSTADSVHRYYKGTFSALMRATAQRSPEAVLQKIMDSVARLEGALVGAKEMDKEENWARKSDSTITVSIPATGFFDGDDHYNVYKQDDGTWLHSEMDDTEYYARGQEGYKTPKEAAQALSEVVRWTLSNELKYEQGRLDAELALPKKVLRAFANLFPNAKDRLSLSEAPAGAIFQKASADAERANARTPQRRQEFIERRLIETANTLIEDYELRGELYALAAQVSELPASMFEPAAERPTSPTYQVTVKATDGEILDWNATVAEQHPQVREKLKGVIKLRWSEFAGLHSASFGRSSFGSIKRVKPKGAMETLAEKAGKFKAFETFMHRNDNYDPELDGKRFASLEEAKEAFEKLLAERAKTFKGEQIYARAGELNKPSGKEKFDAEQARASEYLQSLGIVGHKYNASGGKQDKFPNYVIYDDSRVETNFVQFNKEGTKRGNKDISDTERKEIEDYILKTLGPQVQVLFKRLRIGSAKWQRKNGAGVVTIGLRAINPLSKAHHEAMHEFFQRLMDDDSPAADILRKAANSAPIRRQVERFFANEPNKAAIMADFDADEHERVAYMFQLWAAGKLNIGPKTETVFQRVLNFFREFFGLLSNDAKAERILQAFHEGRMSEASAVAAVLAKDIDTRNAYLAKMLKVVEPLWEKVRETVMTAQGVMAETKNPELLRIMRQFVNTADSEDEEIGFLSARIQQTNKMLNRVSAIYKDADEEDMKQALEGLQSGVLHADPKIQTMQKRTLKMLEQIHDWLPDEAKPRKRKNYFPRVWEPTEIGANVDEFIQMLMDDHLATTGKTLDRDAAEGIAHTIIANRGAEPMAENEWSVGFSPYMRAASKRQLGFIKNPAFSKFQNKNLVEIMSTYVSHAVHRGEYTKRFGLRGEKLEFGLRDAVGHEVDHRTKAGTWAAAQKKAEQKLKKSNAQRRKLNQPVEQTHPNVDDIVNELDAAGKEAFRKAEGLLHRARRAVMAMEGTLGHDISDGARKWSSGAIVYENVRLLWLSLFSQFVDPLGIIVRGGKASEAWEAYKRGITSVYQGWKGTPAQDSAAKLARKLGIIDTMGALNTMGNLYSSVFLGRSAKKINDSLFRWNGVEAFANGVRIGAMEAAIQFIKFHGGTGDKHSTRYLKELGLTKADVVITAGSEWGIDPFDPKMQQAIFRWVESSQVRPNAALRPSWSSDPHYAIFFHMKQFTYAFHKIILERVVHEAKNGNSNPAFMMVAAYVPVMLAADLIRALVGNGGELPAWMKRWNAGDYITHAVQRAGLLGIPQLGFDAVEWGPTDLAGPSVSHALSTGEALIDGRFGKATEDFLPKVGVLRDLSPIY